jgi:hypothetical protein
MSSRREQKERARAERLQREAELRARRRRKRRRVGLTVTVTALALLAGAVAVAAQGGASHGGAVSALPSGTLAPLASLGTLNPPGAPGPVGPEGVPVPDAREIAGGEPAGASSPVDGIECQTTEQVLFHIHAHLTVFVDGAARRIPYGIGIPGAQASPTPAGPYVGAGSCFYWLHTHAADGIIHIESPVARTYTLGDFFDVWGEPLGPAEVGPARGTVTSFYDGRLFRGNPRDIPLTRHAQIQLDVGRPLVAPGKISFPPGL